MPEFSIVTAGQPKGLVSDTQLQKKKVLHKVYRLLPYPPIYPVGTGGFFSAKNKVAKQDAYQSPPICKWSTCVELYLHCAKCLLGVVIG
jgi:hypothetical protein